MRKKVKIRKYWHDNKKTNLIKGNVFKKNHQSIEFIGYIVEHYTENNYNEFTMDKKISHTNIENNEMISDNIQTNTTINTLTTDNYIIISNSEGW